MSVGIEAVLAKGAAHGGYFFWSVVECFGRVVGHADESAVMCA